MYSWFVLQQQVATVADPLYQCICILVCIIYAVFMFVIELSN